MSEGISVSIVSHGHGQLVLDLLADIKRLSSPYVSEVILTLNIPERSLFEPPVLNVPLRIIENMMPKGFGANHNYALREARGRAFAIMNPDLRLDDDPFGLLIGALDRAGVVLSGPCVLDNLGHQAPSARAMYTPLEIASRLWRDPVVAHNPDWLAGMFLLVDSLAYRSIGGFDERYFLYIEDVDLCTRLRLQAGRLALVPEARVRHAAQHASHRSFRHLRWHLSSMIRYWTSPGFWRLLRSRATR